MRKELLPIAALGVWFSALPATADELTMPAPSAAPAGLPTKGTSMSEVEKTFGEPSLKHPTVGGGSPRQPPITRWDYPGFSVIFEKDKVVHSVVPGAPPPIQNKQELQPVPAEAPSATYEVPAEPAAAPPAESAPPAEPAAPPAEEVPPSSSDSLQPGTMQPPPADLAAPPPGEPEPQPAK